MSQYQDAEPLHVFTDLGANMQSQVFLTGLGFRVVLKDLDADEPVNYIKTFKEEQKAIDYAKSLVAH